MSKFMNPFFVADLPEVEIDFDALERICKAKLTDGQRREIEYRVQCCHALRDAETNASGIETMQARLKGVREASHALASRLEDCGAEHGSTHGFLMKTYPTDRKEYVSPYMEPEELVDFLRELVVNIDTALATPGYFGEPISGERILEDFFLTLRDVLLEANPGIGQTAILDAATFLCGDTPEIRRVFWKTQGGAT